MQYGTQHISKETVSTYQGSSTWNTTTNSIISLGSMGVVDQRVADLYSMWQTVYVHLIKEKYTIDT